MSERQEIFDAVKEAANEHKLPEELATEPLSLMFEAVPFWQVQGTKTELEATLRSFIEKHANL